jgi:hypothetical protein
VYCPNCTKEVDLSASACPHCGADFTSPEGWHPVEIPGTWKPTFTKADANVNFAIRLLLALVALLPFAFMFLLLALFSCKEGCGGFGSLGLVLLVGLGVVVAWAARPHLRVTRQTSSSPDKGDAN